MFVQTDQETLILSIPALYKNDFSHHTLEALPELERCARFRVSEDRSGFEFFLEFEVQKNTIGEFWYYRHPSKIIDWTKDALTILSVQDLHKERRFSYDGYYFTTPTSYLPYSKNGFFRHSANYTGASLIRNFQKTPLANLGYAFTKICLENQTEEGFFATGPTSTWLKTDYGIEYDFYDSRFSTDFARSLVDAYKIFDDKECLLAAKKYADFLVNFANNYGYKVGKAPNTGILVPDYYAKSMKKNTHVSLNHQVAEINFLLELYMATNKDNGYRLYYDMANKMISGVNATCDEWILKDGNLKYALKYKESSNLMVDYPYLTYNDLFQLKKNLEKLNIKNSYVDKLMSTKKTYMDKNNITGYLKSN